MKFIKHFFLASLLISTTLTSCYNEDDDELIIEPPVEWNTQLTVSERKTKTDGSPATNYTEVYNYSYFIRLSSCNMQNTSGNYTATNQFTLTETTNPYTRIYTDDQGDEWVYSISEENGLAAYATYSSGGQVRTYQFGYATGQQLASIVEYIDGELFSTIKFDYIGNTGATMTITMNGFTEVANIRYTDDVKWNAFPNYFLMEIHPLSIHRVAFYDGLFGINYRVIAGMQYEGSDEVTTFTYNADLGATTIMPQYCTQTITGEYLEYNVYTGEREPKQYSYTRTVNYLLEDLYTK